MSMATTESNDIIVSGSCATLDTTTAVPIYDFSAEQDGAYTVEVTVLGWEVGGPCFETWVQANWKVIAGVLSVDGTVNATVLVTGTLAPGAITTDVNSGRARLLVTGGTNQPILWRVKGERFDVTA